MIWTLNYKAPNQVNILQTTASSGQQKNSMLHCTCKKHGWSIKIDNYKAAMQYEPKHSHLDIYQRLPIIDEKIDAEKHQISVYKKKKIPLGSELQQY